MAVVGRVGAAAAVGWDVVAREALLYTVVVDTWAFSASLVVVVAAAVAAV